MKIPSAITLTDVAYSLDGGSMYLMGHAPDGSSHQFSLPQHRFKENFRSGVVPGRLHLDGVPVPVRSDVEAQLIEILRNASIEVEEEEEPPEASAPAPRLILSPDIEAYLASVDESPAAPITLLLKRVLDFVESDEYCAIAREIDAER